jgi:hypothetical protein
MIVSAFGNNPRLARQQNLIGCQAGNNHFHALNHFQFETVVAPLENLIALENIFLPGVHQAASLSLHIVRNMVPHVPDIANDNLDRCQNCMGFETLSQLDIQQVSL